MDSDVFQINALDSLIRLATLIRDYTHDTGSFTVMHIFKPM